MNRIQNIQSIQIDIDEVIKIEITRNDKTIEVMFIELGDTDKVRAMNEFLDTFQLRDVTKVTMDVAL